MSDELPQGWTIARIDEVAHDVRSGFASGNKNIDGGLSHLRMNNIGVSGELVLDVLRAVPLNLTKPDYLLSYGDILVCTTNSTKLVGKCAFFNLTGRYAFSNHLTRLRPVSQLVDGKFLCWNLWFLWKSGLFDEKCKHWVNQSTLPKEDLLNTSVLIPPIKEQRRIVAKLEKLLDKVDSCQKRLAKVPILLKRFRQAVLDAACSGFLTADWREHNGITVESQEIVEAPEGFPSLPKTWRWRPLLSVCDNIVDCPHSTPKWTYTGRVCARTTNFKPGYLDLSEVRYVSERTFEERIERLQPKPGDILYSREGGILGVGCIIPKGVNLCLGQRMMLFRVNGEVKNELLMHWLNGSPILRHVGKLTGGSASPHLNVRDIKTFPTPVPPVAEQDIIIRRVGELFSLADQIEARFAKAKQYVDSLKQSILAKAFRGELVPQDPNDEPATVLIERVRETRASRQPNRFGTKGKRTHRNSDPHLQPESTISTTTSRFTVRRG